MITKVLNGYKVIKIVSQEHHVENDKIKELQEMVQHLIK